MEPFGARPRDGEQDCLLGLPLGTGSTDEDRELGAPGLPLVAESGLSGNVVLKFGGASSENPGIFEGFHGLDFTVGEAPRDGIGFFDVVGAGLVTEDDLVVGAEDILGPPDGVDGRRVGVADLDVDFGGGTEDLEVGVEDLAVDRVGVEDLVVDREGVEDLEGTEGFAAEAAVLLAETVGFVAETMGLVAEAVGLVAEIADLADVKVARDVGVEDLEGLDVIVVVGRPVGVAGLDPGPPDEEGLRSPVLEAFKPGEEVDCLDTKLFLPEASGWGFASYKHRNTTFSVQSKNITNTISE